MKRFGKVTVTLILVLSLMAVLFAGCTGGDANEEKSNEVTTGNETNISADESTTDDELEPVTLTWYYIGDSQPDEEAVWAAANEIIKSEINATVEFIRYGWGDYEQKLQLMTAGREEYDLCFSAGWINNYKNNVENGAYMVLDEMLYEYAPKTMEMIPDNITEGTKIGGHLYGIPGYQVSFRQPALIFKKEVIDKYDLKDDIFAIKTLDDLTPILAKIKAGEPDLFMTDLTMDWIKFYQPAKDDYLHLVMGNTPIYLDYDYKVYSALDQEVYALDMEIAERAREWNKAGFFHKDVGMGLASDFSTERGEGKFFVLNDVNKPGVEADMKNRYGYDVYAVPLGMSTISTGSITSNMTTVSATSKNPERAVMLLELMNTNKDLYNMIVFGLEGQHYEKTGEDSIEVTNAAGYSGMAWMMGCQFNAYKLPGQSDDVWEVTKQLNGEALSSPDLGFYFNDANVTTELANVQAVYKEYREILHYGLVDNYAELLDERNAKLEKAGIQAIVDEMQAQINDWVANK